MNKFSALVNAAKVAFDHYWKRHQAECQHLWRPTRTSIGPARYCTNCDKIDQLTTEDYYAQFGTMPHSWY